MGYNNLSFLYLSTPSLCSTPTSWLLILIHVTYIFRVVLSFSHNSNELKLILSFAPDPRSALNFDFVSCNPRKVAFKTIAHKDFLFLKRRFFISIILWISQCVFLLRIGTSYQLFLCCNFLGKLKTI